jgi:nitrate reductase NapAB chaperone NapD
MVIAGILIETVHGAVARVASRLLALPGISLQGGDGQRRIAAVVQAASGAALEELTQRLLAGDEEILGVFPTFVGAEEDSA